MGHLFVFEGPDGNGKTTLLDAVYDELLQQGYPVVRNWFPGKEDGTLGKHIYELHHNASNYDIQNVNPASLQILHIAAHIDLIESTLLPALRKGKILLLDRYWWSTYVYGKVSNINISALEKMKDLEMCFWKKIYPSAVLLIKRKDFPFRKEHSLHKWTRLKNEYDSLLNKEKSKYPVYEVYNENSIDEVKNNIFNIIISTIEAKK